MCFESVSLVELLGIICMLLVIPIGWWLWIMADECLSSSAAAAFQWEGDEEFRPVERHRGW